MPRRLSALLILVTMIGGAGLLRPATAEARTEDAANPGAERVVERIAQGGSATFFRIGTGGVNGTYYPIGGIIANAISSPPGSRACNDGGSCGVQNLIAIAVSSDGSVSNVRNIQAGVLDSGFAQADVAYNAYNATGAFAQYAPMDKLRVIASLYAERTQIVARTDSGIAGVPDLAGQRVSLDEPGSGTLILARDLLAAYGLRESAVIAEYMKPGPAASKMLRGELDAFFIVAGVPTIAVSDLVEHNMAAVVPIDGPPLADLLQQHPFLARAPIPAGTYPGQEVDIPTFGVVAQWVTSADLPDALIQEICLALWNEATGRLLKGGHPTGAQIRLEQALDGVAIPLHPGAEACYRELELID